MISKRFLLSLSGIVVLFAVSACSCGNEKEHLDQKEKEAVEQQLQKDQAAMDSLDKAIQAQIEGVEKDSTDSLDDNH